MCDHNYGGNQTKQINGKMMYSVSIEEGCLRIIVYVYSTCQKYAIECGPTVYGF
jgi:hypothetical protein